METFTISLSGILVLKACTRPYENPVPRPHLYHPWVIILTSFSKAASIARKTLQGYERRLAAGEATMAIDGSRALLCPSIGIVVLSSLWSHAARRLPPRKLGAPKSQERRGQEFKQRIRR